MTRSTRPRISKRVRDEAALICAIAASEVPESLMFRGPRAYYLNIGEHLGAGRNVSRGVRLANAVWSRLTNGGRGLWTQALDVEAEALLRCGWSPGDEL
jgi:hypothetical protein